MKTAKKPVKSKPLVKKDTKRVVGVNLTKDKHLTLRQKYKVAFPDVWHFKEPDLCRDYWNNGYWHGYECTRPTGHTGIHVAGGNEENNCEVQAAWGCFLKDERAAFRMAARMEAPYGVAGPIEIRTVEDRLDKIEQALYRLVSFHHLEDKDGTKTDGDPASVRQTDGV